MRFKFRTALFMFIVLLTCFAYADQQTAQVTNPGYVPIGPALNGGNGGTGGTGGTTGGSTGGTSGGSQGGTGVTQGGSTGGGSTGGGSTGGGSTGGSSSGGQQGGTGGTGGSSGGSSGGVGCTRTQGYWGSSPAGQALLIQLVGNNGMDLGNVNYTAGELDDILDQPVQGNALISLAHQEIAAKLNVLNGADGSQIMDDLAVADGLIGNRVVPPVGNSTVSNASQLGQQMNAVKDTLDDYNNGDLNVPHCN